jgi:membrane-associated phospholipid phosphatase
MNGVSDALVAWDRSTFHAINSGMQNPVFDRVMPFITDLGLLHVQALLVLGLAVLLGLRAGEMRVRQAGGGIVRIVRSPSHWVGPVLLAYALSGLASTVIKNGVSRHRPWWHYQNQHLEGRDLDVQVRTLPGIRPVRVRGFPSGHTATTTALATVLTLLAIRRKRWYGWAAATWLFAAAVGFSRIYIADHWPLDVVGGAIIGIVSGTIAVWFWLRRAVEQVRDESPNPEVAG